MSTALFNSLRTNLAFNQFLSSYWLPSERISNKMSGIHNINSFETFNLEIDFTKPEEAQNKLIEITNYVEKECPVAREFNVKGLGEGVVWTGMFKDSVYRFKVKGEKHSISKVKKLAPVDTEKINSIKEFVIYAVTDNRLVQAQNEILSIENKLQGEQIKLKTYWLYAFIFAFIAVVLALIVNLERIFSSIKNIFSYIANSTFRELLSIGFIYAGNC